jgi:hypothetical protein
MREMMSDLNRMLRERAEGGEPDFQAFTQMDVLNVVDRLAAAA